MEILLCQTIAEEMEQKIKKGEWKKDDKLPSERILSETYNVSRTVIREALKILNEKSLVVNQPGRGNYVTTPGTDTIISQFESMISYNNIPLSDVVEAREELEIVIAQKAIQNVCREQTKKLELFYQMMENSLDNPLSFNDCDYKFHLQLAKCSGNQALEMVFSSLYFITGKNTYLSITSTREIREHAQKEHLEILNALKTRSPRNMSQAIRRHMKCIHEHLISS